MSEMYRLNRNIILRDRSYVQYILTKFSSKIVKLMKNKNLEKRINDSEFANGLRDNQPLLILYHQNDHFSKKI